MYGYTAEEIIGQPIEVVCPPDRVAEIQGILSKIRSGERVPYHETARQRKDGTIFPVSVAISPVWDDRHGLVGASSIARDISERYRIQAELRLRTADLECATGTWRPSPIRSPMTCVPRCERWTGSVTPC
jgi:PAS domain S-box-containing protein